MFAMQSFIFQQLIHDVGKLFLTVVIIFFYLISLQTNIRLLNAVYLISILTKLID